MAENHDFLLQMVVYGDCNAVIWYNSLGGSNFYIIATTNDGKTLRDRYGFLFQYHLKSTPICLHYLIKVDLYSHCTYRMYTVMFPLFFLYYTNLFRVIFLNASPSKLEHALSNL